MGASLPLFLSNYDSIVSQSIAAGIDVYHLIAFWEPNFDQTLISNHVYSTYSQDKIIDCLTYFAHSFLSSNK